MSSVMQDNAISLTFPSRIEVPNARWTVNEIAAIRESLLHSVDCIDSGPVLIDLRSVEFIDSLGIGLLVALIVDLKKKGYSSAVAYKHNNIGDIFQVMGLEFYSQIIKSENDK